MEFSFSYETMMTRHTTMCVGPTGGGKSVVIHTLCQAQVGVESRYENRLGNTHVLSRHPYERQVLREGFSILLSRCTLTI